MDIAICLSGLIRYPDNALRTIQKIIPNQNVKIFIHTWRVQNKEFFTSKVFQPEYKELNRIAEDSIGFLDSFNYESALVENFSSLEPKFNKIYSDILKSCNPIDNYTISPISMYYSIFKSNELKMKYEDENSMVFDKVVRMRMDSDYIYDEDFDLSKYDGDLCIPSGEDWDGGINDQFAFGKSYIMDQYSNVYNNLYNIEFEKYQPETMLRQNLEYYNLVPDRPEIYIRINNGNYGKHVLYPDWIF
jgi:hypothetical protein